MHERLRRPLGHLAQSARPPPGPTRGRRARRRSAPARPSPRPGSRRRPAPRPGPVASVSIARISSSGRRAARPVGAHQHLRQARAVVEAPRHRDRRSSRTIAPRSWLALEPERAGQAGQQPDAQLGVSRRRAPRAPPRAARPRPARRRPGASRPPRSRSRPGRAARASPSSRAISAAAANASSASVALPARWLAAPSSSRTSARSARVLDPELERGAQPRRRLVEGERGARRARRAQVVVDRRARPRRAARRRRSDGRGRRGRGRSAAPAPRAPRPRAGAARPAAAARAGRRAPAARARG